MDIDILCKVVDNYGDIGVVYRLARSLSELPEAPRLRLVVDGLAAFARLDPAIDSNAVCQTAHGWEVFRWKSALGETPGPAREAFSSRRARFLIECFACGRPDWLEDIIFDPDAEEGCLIVDLEHLTAEAYAADFHRMPSLTRSSQVRKALFFPGFVEGTGGLLLDRAFSSCCERASSDAGRAGMRREALARLARRGFEPVGRASGADQGAEERFWVCIFAYERDYAKIVADLAEFGLRRPALVLVAAGRSQDCFLRAWTDALRPFPALILPFLAQEIWDELLVASDFSIVRGEDSWSRAALAGHPFLWQAYPQDGRHQLVKVSAFLDRLRPRFGVDTSASAEAFRILESLYFAFNDRERDGTGEGGEERILPVLRRHAELLPGFLAFSRTLRKNGSLASGLITFLRDFV